MLNLNQQGALYMVVVHSTAQHSSDNLPPVRLLPSTGQMLSDVWNLFPWTFPLGHFPWQPLLMAYLTKTC